MFNVEFEGKSMHLLNPVLQGLFFLYLFLNSAI